MWQNIRGRDPVVEHFRGILAADRLASAYLFVGPEGIGKHTFALKLAQAMLCQNTDETALDPCGRCESCVSAISGNHADIHTVAKWDDKNNLLIVQIRGGVDKDHGPQVGLCHEIIFKPTVGRRKIAIIDDADLLSIPSANALLKTLEEPPHGVVLILIGTSASRQLVTIRSRSQIVRFDPLRPEAIAQVLLEHQTVKSDEEAQRLASHANGSMAQAILLADPQMQEFRVALVKKLAESPFDSVRLSEIVNAYVSAAGREAIDRRGRLRRVISMVIDFYRVQMREAVGAPAAEQQSRTWNGSPESASLPADTAATCIERCFEALDHVDRYANQATLIATWFDDLANLTDASLTTR